MKNKCFERKIRKLDKIVFVLIVQIEKLLMEFRLMSVELNME